jgi:hypothetical protein
VGAVPEWVFPLAGFIDTSGKWVIKPQFDMAGAFHEGLARAKLMDTLGTWAFVSRSGAIIKVPAQEVTPVSMVLRDVSEGLAAFSPTGEAFGFMRIDGSLAVAPAYRSVRDFHEGLANVCNDKCGFIDLQGMIAVPLIYSAAGDFENGRARVCGAGKCGYVDKKVAFSSSPDVFLIGESFWQHIVEPNPYGLHSFCPEALCGYLDDRQRVVIRPQFRRAEEFSEGLAAVDIDEYGTCGYIDKAGKFAIPAIFQSCDAFRNGLAAIDIFNKNLGTSAGYIDKGGKLIWLSTVGGLAGAPILQRPKVRPR